MPTDLLYLGSVYRLADVETDTEFSAKMHRWFGEADTKFRYVFSDNRDQLTSLVGEAKEKYPDDVSAQRQYWAEKVMDILPIRSLVGTFGPSIQHPLGDPVRENNLSPNRSTKNLRLLEKKNNAARAQDTAYLLGRMAELFFNEQYYDPQTIEKAYNEFFGKATKERITDPSNGEKHTVWDTSSGLVKWWEDAKRTRQQSRHMNPIYRRSPFLHQMMAKFFPKPVILIVNAENVLQDEMSAYGNRVKDEIHKTAVMAKTLASWNTLMSALDRDMKADDEYIRLVAMATSIVTRTGIRPAVKGESTLRPDPEGDIDYEIVTDTGDEVRVKTFGAAGLNVGHVEVLRKDLVNLKFVGKYSTKNLAIVDDETLVSALVEQVGKAVARGGGNIFVTKAGRVISDKSINEYLRRVLNQGTVRTLDEKSGEWVEVEEKPITAYSFRRLIATQGFYDSLKDRKPEMAAELRALKLKLVDNMSAKAIKDISQQITDVVGSYLDKAAQDVRKQLSHAEASEIRHAMGNYVSHRVMLEYLSLNGALQSMETIVGEGYKVTVQFDPIDFFKTMMAEYPATASVIKAWSSGAPAQSGATGTFVTRGPVMLPFAPDALIAWAENRKWTGAWAPVQEAPPMAQEALPMAANTQLRTELPRTTRSTNMSTSQYLMFRGAVYRLAYKDLGKLLDEDTTIKVNASIKTLTSSWEAFKETYPQAQKQFRQLKKVLVQVNPNLEASLTEDETAAFHKQRYRSTEGAVSHFIDTGFYLGRFKQLNKLSNSHSVEEMRDISEPLQQVDASLKKDIEISARLFAWLKSISTLSTNLMNLVQSFSRYKRSKKPNERAAYKKYIELMGELPQNPAQLVDKIVETTRLLNAILLSRAKLLNIYGTVNAKVQQKAQKAFTKYMRLDKEQREKNQPGSESSPIELTKRKFAPPQQQKQQASVHGARRNHRSRNQNSRK